MSIDPEMEEILNLFGYELSDLQIGKAFDAYGCSDKSVDDGPAYKRAA